MRVVPWASRLVAVTAVAACAGGVAVLPVASATAEVRPAAVRSAAVRSAAAREASRAAVAAAAAGQAPVVTDARPDTATKAGLAAPVLSSSMALANTGRQAAARRLLQLMAHRMGPDSKCSSLACRAGLPAARNLAATQQPQALDYFCGPATVSEMLAQVGVKVTQVTAARELGTNASGTDWSDARGYPVPRVLNDNQTRNEYVAVALPWTPTAQQLSTYEVDLVTDINHNGGVPLAGNAYEVAGGPHLVGNPVNQTIMHWFDIRGYQKYGRITDYEDSVHDATSIGWALNVPAYSSIASSTVVDILGARGYDW
jgi:hypothetical protein